MKPTISFIVPIYNVEEYIGTCIESILFQNYKNFEIILVNDGSTDDSESVCKRYNDPRVKLIKKSNGGLSSARNSGLREAKGEFILFVDSDDFIEKNSIVKIVEVLNEGEDFDLVFLEGINYYKELDKKISFNEGIKKDVLKVQGLDILNYFEKLPKFPGSSCSKMIRREFLEENNLYFKEGITNEDLEWTMRVITVAKKFNYSEQKYYYYRQNRIGSITSKISKEKFEDFLQFIESWINRDIEGKYGEYKNAIFSLMAYESTILLAKYGELKNEDKLYFEVRVNTCLKILKYRSDKKTKLINIVYRIFGVFITAKILSWYLRQRERGRK